MQQVRAQAAAMAAAVVGLAATAAQAKSEVAPYLRLDLGYDIGVVGGSTGNLGTGSGIGNDFGSGFVGGGGVGLKFPGEIRQVSFRLDLSTAWSPSLGGDRHSATLGNGTPIAANVSINNQVYLANLYTDLDIGGPITPFIGLGAGGSYSQLKPMTFSNPSGNFATVEGRNSSGAAGSVSVGASYAVAGPVTLDAAYRYVYAGVVKSGTHITDLTQSPPAPQLLDRPIASSLNLHAFLLSVRYAF